MALMGKLEERAEKDPKRMRFLKKANCKQLIKEGDEVVGLEYEYQGKTHKAHGPVILCVPLSSELELKSCRRRGESVVGVGGARDLASVRLSASAR